MRPRRLRWWLPLALPLAPAATSAAQNPRACRTDYRIEARLEPETRELSGKETITWTNRSRDTVSDAWFHLHLNAYSNNLTTHLWESGGRLRGHRPRDGWSRQEVTSLRVGRTELVESLTWQRPDDGRESDHTVFSVQLPDPVPPGGSATFELEWESTVPRVRRRTGTKDDFVLLAHWFPKLGVYEDGRGWNCHQFHANTEFYADYGTYDVTLDLPDRYAELVDDEDEKRLVAKVGASGMPVGTPVVEDGRLRVRFAAPGLEDRERVDPLATGIEGAVPLVHGFAWTADPRYVIRERTFDMEKWIEGHEDPLLVERLRSERAAAAAAFGEDPETFGVRPVEVVVMIHPEREGQWERHFEATAAALYFYGIWFGEYPYSRVTVVDPAWGARAAGGMEYPTLFTCGTSLFTRPQTHRPESVTVHECGHQFWYGLVGNNEYEAAWLDEGFNSYADSEVLARVWGPRRATTRYSSLPVWRVATVPDPADRGLAGILTGQRWDLGELGGERWIFEPLAPSPFVDWWRDQPWLTFADDLRDPRWSDRSRYLGEPDADPVATAGWLYLNRQSYGVNSYPRPAVALRSLAGVVGETAFRRGMRHYAMQWRYRHPYPADFYAAFQEGSSTDVQWYFDELFEGTGTVDWGVSVEQRRVPQPRGLFLTAGTYVEARPDPEEIAEEDPAGGDEEPEYTGLEEERQADDARPWTYDVVVRRRGELRLPLVVEVTFADDTVQTFQWTREMQLEAATSWWRLELRDGPQPIERVLIDPERRYYIDANMSDNQWYAREDPIVPMRWGERAFTQFLHMLHWYSSLGG